MAVLQFKGTSALTLDAKGRVNVPTRHRDALMQHCAGQLTVCKHPHGYLMVLPRPAWEPFAERLNALPMDADGWRRVFMGSAVDVEIDSAGRLHVTPELRADAALVRDVLLVGNGSRLELWDASRHAAFEAALCQQAMPETLKAFVF